MILFKLKYAIPSHRTPANSARGHRVAGEVLHSDSMASFPLQWILLRKTELPEAVELGKEPVEEIVKKHDASYSFLYLNKVV